MRTFWRSTTILVFFAAACARDTPFPGAGKAVATLTGARHFDHVVIIVLENEDATTVEAVPYMDSLARTGALLRNYFGVAHPSYPNYLALVAGKTFVGSPEARPDPVAYNRREFGDAQMQISAPSIANSLEAQKLTWDLFAEDYPIKDSLPAKCDFRSAAGLYSRKHVPLLSFALFHEHPELCAHVRDLRWLRPDSLAAYTFITPNMVHDGHDASLSVAVTWLRTFLNRLTSNQKLMESTLVVVTFDESSTSVFEKIRGKSHANAVFTVLLGGVVKPGSASDEVYSHYSLLQTIEENFNLSPALAPQGTTSIKDVWR